MNKHHFKSLYGAMRGVGRTKMPPMLLMSYEKPVMLAVFNNRLPGRDALAVRASRKRAFDAYRAQGINVPANPLLNEYVLAGKLDASDLRRVA